MKNIFKSLLAVSALSLALISCEDEQDLSFLTPEAEFEILSPNSGDAVELNPETTTNPGLSLTWSEADFGTPTEITYTIEIDKTGDEFDSPYVVTSTTNTFVTINSEELNGAALAVGLTPFSQEGIDIRIKATIGTGTNESYSNTIVYLVTSYSTDLPKLAVPGNHQGWSDANNFESAPRIAASGFGLTDYEGYMWLDGEFKFLGPNGSGNFAWGNTDWGDNGDFSGILAEANESNCTAVAGFYRVRANTEALTYTTTAVSWGIIGAATPNGWDSDTDFTYNPATKKLEIASIALVPGAFKFRGNNAWSNGFDLGTVNADGFLVEGGDLTFSGAAGNYKVILDLSNPREYTYEFIAL
ncbi:SusE domain-containing protein [Flavobacterium sp. UBA7663]|uniref:SusE domain-containing protein n=1 Tax=Flavobacterium sp. UBA7663 TaxID=1946557 RepID=UPI0025C251AF|nr:SusE domain-containing protein [Flavobacterium sp. UBA7663]